MAPQGFPKLRPRACALFPCITSHWAPPLPWDEAVSWGWMHVPVRASVIPSSRYSQQLGDRHMDPAKESWVEPHRIHYSRKWQPRQIFITCRLKSHSPEHWLSSILHVGGLHAGCSLEHTVRELGRQDDGSGWENELLGSCIRDLGLPHRELWS